MTIPARMADHLDELATAIVANYGPARQQLWQWTGEHRSAVIGASPPTTRTPASDPDDEPDHGTVVERLALTPDHAIRTLAQMADHLARLAAAGRDLWAAIDGVAIPRPDDTDPARLAVVMWTVRRIHADRHAVNPGDIADIVRRLQLLDAICRIHLPPPATRIVDACHAHLAAGLETEVSIHYRRHHLCRWCGDFRTTHGVNPTPMLVKLHDRGIKITTTHIRRAGVKVGVA